MREIVLLDGGMGQELIRRSALPPHPLWSAKVLIDRPDLVERVHCDFIDAGARIITVNNYTVTPTALARFELADELGWLQHLAVTVAVQARQASGSPFGPVKIAGCLPPLGRSYRPEMTPSDAECLQDYRRLAAVQAEQVDLFVCETMSSIREGQAAAQAALETGLPVWLAFTVDDIDGRRLRSGELLADAREMAFALGVQAVLLNCSAPEAVSAGVVDLGGDLPFGAYANGFVSVRPLQMGGTIANMQARSDVDAQRYADFALNWIEAGATIVGGCCEIGPEHIARLHAALLDAGITVGNAIGAAELASA